MKIKIICDALLAALDEASYNENTIFNYKGYLHEWCNYTRKYHGLKCTHMVTNKNYRSLTLM